MAASQTVLALSALGSVAGIAAFAMAMPTRALGDPAPSTRRSGLLVVGAVAALQLSVSVACSGWMAGLFVPSAAWMVAGMVAPTVLDARGGAAVRTSMRIGLTAIAAAWIVWLGVAVAGPRV